MHVECQSISSTNNDCNYLCSAQQSVESRESWTGTDDGCQENTEGNQEIRREA